MSENEKELLMERLKVYPGQKCKFLAFFDLIQEIYPLRSRGSQQSQRSQKSEKFIGKIEKISQPSTGTSESIRKRKTSQKNIPTIVTNLKETINSENDNLRKNFRSNFLANTQSIRSNYKNIYKGKNCIKPISSASQVSNSSNTLVPKESKKLLETLNKKININKELGVGYFLDDNKEAAKEIDNLIINLKNYASIVEHKENENCNIKTNKNCNEPIRNKNLKKNSYNPPEKNTFRKIKQKNLIDNKQIKTNKDDIEPKKPNISSKSIIKKNRNSNSSNDKKTDILSESKDNNSMKSPQIKSPISRLSSYSQSFEDNLHDLHESQKCVKNDALEIVNEAIENTQDNDQKSEENNDFVEESKAKEYTADFENEKEESKNNGSLVNVFFESNNKPKNDLPIQTENIKEDVQKENSLIKINENHLKFGYSHDLAKVIGGIKEIDLKFMYRCLAHVIKKHINFAQNCFLISDLGNKKFQHNDNNLLNITIHPDSFLGSKSKPNILDKSKMKLIFQESISNYVQTKQDYLNADNINCKNDLNEDELSFTKSQLEEFFKNHKSENGIDVDDLISKYKNSYSNHSKRLKPEHIIINCHDDLKKLKMQPSQQSISSQVSAGLSYSNSLPNINNKPPQLITKFPDNALENHYEDSEKMLESEYLDNIGYKNENDYLITKFSIFNDNYDFENETFFPIQKIEDSSEKDIRKFCKSILKICKMEKEIPIITLIYLEKLITKTGLLINNLNWKRTTFTALIIASKVNLK